MNVGIPLEIACSSLDAVKVAQHHGADRLELCVDLGCGGVSPSVGLLEAAMSLTDLPIFVLIRVREGDFIYSESEKEAMLSDIKHFTSAGAHGLVVGATTQNRCIDEDFARKCRDATSLPLTFHRAFDVCEHQLEGAELLGSIGYDRILTSGGAPTAIEGASTLAQLVKLRKRPIILAGGGIRPDNLHQVLATGADEIHSAALQCVKGGSTSGLFDPNYATVNSSIIDEIKRSMSMSRGK